MDHELLKLFNIKRNQIQMMKDRGFNVEEEEWLLDANVTLEDFADYVRELRDLNKSPTIRNALMNLYNEEGTAQARKPTFVYYADVEKGSKSVGYDEVVKFSSFYDTLSTKFRKAVIIIPEDFSSKAREHITKSLLFKVQIFKDNELDFNPTLHMLVPKHSLATEEEKKEVLKRYQYNKLPMILTGDAIAKWYSFEIGDLVKIDRVRWTEEDMVQRYKYYRQVVPGNL